MPKQYQHAPDPYDMMGGPAPVGATRLTAAEPRPESTPDAASSERKPVQRPAHDWTRDHERGLMGNGNL